MKHIFMVNPTAGKGKYQEDLIKKIKLVCEEENADYEIFDENGREKVINFIKEKVKTKDKIRFYACGGDGTLNLVSGLVYQYKNASLGMIPLGTGNDFPRNFKDKELFSNIKMQLLGKEKKIDIIECYIDGKKYYSINMANIGFDADTALIASNIKRSLVGGGFSYISGVVITLFKRLGKKLEIKIDEEDVFEKNCLLTAIANGKFCGGGFKGVPDATLDDGLMDVSIVEKVSRIKFVKLIGKYKQGTHLETKLGKEIVTYKKCSKIEIRSNEEFNLSLDGDIVKTNNVIFTLVPKGIEFVYPKGIESI